MQLQGVVHMYSNQYIVCKFGNKSILICTQLDIRTYTAEIVHKLYCNVLMMLWSPSSGKKRFDDAVITFIRQEMFRWCCDHLHQARNVLMMLWSPSSGKKLFLPDDAVITFIRQETFLAWWRWSQHHQKRCYKVCEQFQQCMSEYRAGYNWGEPERAPH